MCAPFVGAWSEGVDLTAIPAFEIDVKLLRITFLSH